MAFSDIVEFTVTLPYEIKKEENLDMTNYNYSIADMADILHQASMLYMASNLPIDYGTGDTYTPVEVHMLKYIIDHPGKTVTDLSLDWDKTKAAISVMTKKLEQKGLICKKTAPDSFKKQLYYATPKGMELNESHLDYDTAVFGQTLDLLKETCSDEEINLCFHVLAEYNKARRKKHYRSSPV